MSSRPRCPLNNLSHTACVTESCRASPFICVSYQCSCHYAHKYCKTMQWNSLIEMLNNFKENMEPSIKLYMEKVQKVYKNLIEKMKLEMQKFQEYVQGELYGEKFYKTIHFLKKEDYEQITCNSLGEIINKITKIKQEPVKNIEKLTVSEVKNIQTKVSELTETIQSLYKSKYRSIESHLRQSSKNLNSNQLLNKNSSSISSKSSQKHKVINSSIQDFRQNKNSNIFFEQIPMAQSVMLKRTQSTSKSLANFTKTASTFNPKSSVKITQLLLSKQSIIINPQVSRFDLIYPKTINSKILMNASVLNHLLVQKIKQYKLIYRASDQSFKIQNFYKKVHSHTFTCELEKNKNLQKPTLLLIKTEHGKILGGFTKLQWKYAESSKTSKSDESSSEQQSISKYKQDIRGSTFIFSVDLAEKYHLQQPKYGIYCGKHSIGFGKRDIRMSNKCNSNFKSFVGFPSSFNNGNYLPIKKSSFILTGSYDSSHIKILQWQLFQVSFAKKQ